MMLMKHCNCPQNNSSVCSSMLIYYFNRKELKIPNLKHIAALITLTFQFQISDRKLSD